MGGIFDEMSEMEFDDLDTWPVSELIRLDDGNICDINIIFAVHAYIHPLEHASALVVRDQHYDDTVILHFAVRQMNSMASLHSSTLVLILLLNLCDLLQIMKVKIKVDSCLNSNSFKELLSNLISLLRKTQFTHLLWPFDSATNYE